MTSLRQRMTEDMQVRNLALNTQTSYLQQVSLFARHFEKSPEQLGPEHIRDYQVYLTNEKKLAPGSVLIAVAALRFLYKVSLHRDWIFGDVIPAPKKPRNQAHSLKSPSGVSACSKYTAAMPSPVSTRQVDSRSSRTIPSMTIIRYIMIS